MRIYYDLDLKNFEAWSGGKDTLITLTYDQIEQLEAMLPDILGEEASDTELNDLLWFEREAIADWLGFEDWEELENTNEGKSKSWNVYKVTSTVRELLKSCETEDEANDFCEEHDWEFLDEYEFLWELTIEEEWL